MSRFNVLLSMWRMRSCAKGTVWSDLGRSVFRFAGVRVTVVTVIFGRRPCSLSYRRHELGMHHKRVQVCNGEKKRLGRRFEQESPHAFRPPPDQSCALLPCQPCTSWKGHHTLPRKPSSFRKPVWLATAPRARLLHFALRGFSAARIPGCDGRVCAQTPSIRK